MEDIKYRTIRSEISDRISIIKRVVYQRNLIGGKNQILMWYSSVGRVNLLDDRV